MKMIGGEEIGVIIMAGRNEECMNGIEYWCWLT